MGDGFFERRRRRVRRPGRSPWRGATLVLAFAAATAAASVPVPAGAASPIDWIRSLWGGDRLPAGIVGSNGRIEAEQVDVAAKYSGRLASMEVEEGDTVAAGQVIARMDASEYEAQLRGAKADALRARQAEAEADAVIAQSESDLTLATQERDRTLALYEKGHATGQLLDQRRTQLTVAEAKLRAAKASREQATLAIESAEAEVERLEAILKDMILTAPRSGRIQYKLARSGEVVSGGARVATLLDLSDVYMTIYLPAADAGRLSIGDEARIVLDPAPQFIVPATVSFVAADAQFTPKTVETAEERDKLMFRVKLKIDPALLKQYERQVKTGVRGMGYVRVDPQTAWPANLIVKLP